MKKILRYLRSSLGYLYVCFKWVILAALVGCVVGPFGAMFGLALNKATALRTADPRLIYLLPLGGLVIVFLYQHFDPDGGGSTNQIFVAVREHKPLSLRTAPLIFVATVITHLFGGSSGREGAALLLGGSLSGQIGRRLQLEARDCRLMTMCGMAGAFSAVFGTPLAATVFTLEVVDVGSMQYAALLPCLISALIGVWISSGMGLAPTAFAVADYAAPTPGNLIRVLLLGLLLAALSIAFCEVIHAAPKLYKKLFPNAYLRVVVGGALIIALTTLLGTTDYNGAGANVIAAAIAGQAVPYAFLLEDAVHQHHTGGRVRRAARSYPSSSPARPLAARWPRCWGWPPAWARRWAWWHCSAAVPTARWRPAAWPSRCSAGRTLSCSPWPVPSPT